MLVMKPFYGKYIERRINGIEKIEKDECKMVCEGSERIKEDRE